MKISREAELSARAFVVEFKYTITTIQDQIFDQIRHMDCKIWYQDNREKKISNN